MTVAALVATVIGVGTYSEPVTVTGSAYDVGNFIEAAIETWGPLGMILGAGSGVLAGLWMFEYIEHRRAHGG
ncbi:hypothetical protein [Rhodococcus sp. JVH1]|uniref:hypothetical protein n=1 Tax=Rhodococcus sp. JVH1 TaxID=745408 RepID=UPI000271E527|nr:hypothetical protein [Rhodococcus sp. JVH1]EJI98586.1 hypothetical protein JVH1_3842 [Rhodococcus sp. JVH1]